MDDDMNDRMSDVLAKSLEGNALGVKDAINDLMNARAMDALQAMKVDVAQSIYGTYANDEDADADPLSPDDATYFVTQEDDEVVGDDDIDSLFSELDGLVNDSDDEGSEDSDESEEEQDEDDSDV